MTETSDPFVVRDLKQAIDLRWTLRDIRGKRLKLSPIDPIIVKKLVEMGLVEVRDDEVFLTNSGVEVVI